MGVDPNQLPHSGGNLMSGIGHEFSDDSPYAKSHAERTNSKENGSEERV